MEQLNSYGQPVGADVLMDLPCPPLAPVVLEGQFVQVVPMAIEHAEGLFQCVGGADRAPLWTYMPVGPFPGFEAFYGWFEQACESGDPMFFTLNDAETRRPLGFASFLRMAPDVGTAEIGFIMFSKALQCTPAATEALSLMMSHLFDSLGYRRCEWKCDALNTPSRRAAQRLGFVYEGTFRQATVYKGRNRDTAWFSVIDEDWPIVRRGLNKWLDPANFDGQGQQKRRLQECREA